MIEPQIFISPAIKGSDGKFVVDTSKEKDILSVFPNIVYNEIDGMNTYGKAKVYTESFAEEASTDTFFPKEKMYDTTEFNLKLYLIDDSSDKDNASKIDKNIEQYHAIIDELSWKYIRLKDNIRKRKVMLVLSDSVKPTKENLKGVIYTSFTLKFVNIFGRSFALDDNTFFE